MDGTILSIKINNNETIVFQVDKRKNPTYCKNDLCMYDYCYDIKTITHFDNINIDINQLYTGNFLWKTADGIKIYNNIKKVYIDLSNKPIDCVNIHFAYNDKKWYNSELREVVKELLFDTIVTQF